MLKGNRIYKGKKLPKGVTKVERNKATYFYVRVDGERKYCGKDDGGFELARAARQKYEYKKIIDRSGASKESLSTIVDFLYSKKRSGEDIEIFNKIKEIKTDIKELDDKYNWRFWLLLYMIASLIISGLVSLFMVDKFKIWALTPNLLFVIFIFCNLISVHVVEKRYAENITKTMEKL